MNIMDLQVGDTCVSSVGTKYRIVSDSVERRPMIGRVTIRTAEDETGHTHKFIRGIEVERCPQVTEDTRHE